MVSSFVNKGRSGQQKLFHTGIVWTHFNPGGFTPKKFLVQRCRPDGSQFLSSGIGMGLDVCHLVFAISAIRYKDRYRFSNLGIIIGI